MTTSSALPRTCSRSDLGGSQQLTDVQQLSVLGQRHRPARPRGALAVPPAAASPSSSSTSPSPGSSFDDAALIREIVSYQFTTSLSEVVRPGPVLLAHDVAQRIIVITDSGDGATFADLLETDDGERRVNILRNLGTALGRMHSGTAQREHDFEILLTRMLRNHPDFGEIQRLRDTALLQSITIERAAAAQRRI
ncbi:hypothetical protein QP028_15025 [Corynebacterium suedekumii]|nr:hypothetical protein QP028_15025 [Corynebacterium suedekumii]